MQLIKLLLIQLLLVNSQNLGERGQFPGTKTAEDRETASLRERSENVMGFGGRDSIDSGATVGVKGKEFLEKTLWF